MAHESTIDHDYSPDSKSMTDEERTKQTSTVRVEGVELAVDIEEEQVVLRKIDRYILPVMCITFWLQCEYIPLISRRWERIVVGAQSFSAPPRSSSASLPTKLTFSH